MVDLCCDLGIMLAGCVTVSIFHNISEEHFVYEVTHSEAKIIFVADLYCHQLCHDNAASFQHVISLDEPRYKNEETYQDIIDLGKKTLDHGGHFTVPVALPDDLASIIYTSGTTSLPKGVEISHRNLLCQTQHSKEIFHWGTGDRYLSFLPLGHIFGRIMYIVQLYAGCSIYCISDPLQMIKASQEIHPTILILVPRIIDKIYKSIQQKIATSHGIKKMLANWAFNFAKHNKNTFWFKIQHRIADLILYSKIRHMFGGKIRIIISGSAKSNPMQLRFFQNIGLNIYDGYGLTEGTPVSINRPYDVRIGTVGKPMPDIEFKTDPAGEILIRGPVTTRGYFKDPELTASKLDHEGWFHTGDLGVIDPEGSLIVKGRLNEHCKLSTGEFVDIPFIENLLLDMPYADFSLVIAENKPFVTCLLFPNIDQIEQVKKHKGLKDLNHNEFLKQEFVKKEIDKFIDGINQHLDKWAQIRDYRFVHAKASIESGELSPTLKTRRKAIEKKYKHLIDEMYPEHLLTLDF